jgi:hypothetical protein
MYCFYNLGPRRGVGGKRHAPATLPRGNTPLTHRTRSCVDPRASIYGRMQRISPPPSVGPPALQSVASRYTNYAIPAHYFS